MRDNMIDNSSVPSINIYKYSSIILYVSNIILSFLYNPYIWYIS